MGASVFQMYTYELKTGIYMVWFIARAVQAQNTNEESLYFNSFEHLGPKVCTLTFPNKVSAHNLYFNICEHVGPQFCTLTFANMQGPNFVL